MTTIKEIYENDSMYNDIRRMFDFGNRMISNSRKQLSLDVWRYTYRPYIEDILIMDIPNRYPHRYFFEFENKIEGIMLLCKKELK